MIGTVGASLVLIWTFDLCYWPRAPETPVISWVTGVSFVLGRQLWVGSWVAPGWGLDIKKTNLWLDAWHFQFHIPFSWKWRRAENEINGQSCLHDDTSIKSPKYRAQWALGWWRLGESGTSGEGMETLYFFSRALLYGSFPSCYSCVITFIMKQWSK